MTSIHILPDSTVRLLRSSITISSISQCVSELVQNAIDATATKIQIIIDPTHFSVQVTDNGSGITPEDLEKIGNRYATSKCSSLDDLTKIQTFGFRGEALSSIAEVALLEIITRSQHQQQQQPFSLILRGGKRLRYGPSSQSHHQHQIGTTIIVRDIFYTFPVRRKQMNPVDMVEGVRRAVEIIALVCPHVAYTLVDKSKNTKILNTKPSQSHMVSFHQLYGNFFSQHTYSIDYAFGDIIIKGFLSTRGNPSKIHQYVYVNRHYLTSNDIHQSVNTLFSQSRFAKTGDEQLCLGMDGTLPSRKRKDQKRTVEKHPVFLLSISCPRNAFDILMDPAKNVVEFENWSQILTAIRTVVVDFLIDHDFLDKTFRQFYSNGIDTVSSDDNSSVGAAIAFDNEDMVQPLPKIIPLNPQQQAEEEDLEDSNKYLPILNAPPRLSVQDALPVKSGGKVDWDEEFAFGDVLDEDVDVMNTGEEEDEDGIEDREISQTPTSKEHEQQQITSKSGVVYQIYVSPKSNKKFYIDVRTGNSYSVLPDDATTEEQQEKAAPKPSDTIMLLRKRLRPSVISKDSKDKNDPNVTNWAKSLLQKWKNPVLPSKRPTLPLPALNVQDVDATRKSLQERMSTFFTSMNSLQSSTFMYTNELGRCLSKACLPEVKVLKQVDKKFIFGILPKRALMKSNEVGTDNTINGNVLVAIDQHAADERVKLEELWTEFFRGGNLNNEDDGDNDNARRTTVETFPVEPPIPLHFATSEGQLILRYRDQFAIWGIEMETSAPVPDSAPASQRQCTFFRQRERQPDVDNNNSTILFDEFEEPLSTTLHIKTLPRLCADRLITDHRLLSDLLRQHSSWLQSGGTMVSTPNPTLTRVTCPQILLDILNSKACRSAIMFGDTLSDEDCRVLVKNVSACLFPFQCAHGRPSMVPLCEIGGEAFWKLIERSASASASGDRHVGRRRLKHGLLGELKGLKKRFSKVI